MKQIEVKYKEKTRYRLLVNLNNVKQVTHHLITFYGYRLLVNLNNVKLKAITLEGRDGYRLLVNLNNVKPLMKGLKRKLDTDS